MSFLTLFINIITVWKRKYIGFSLLNVTQIHTLTFTLLHQESFPHSHSFLSGSKFGERESNY